MRRDAQNARLAAAGRASQVVRIVRGTAVVARNDDLRRLRGHVQRAPVEVDLRFLSGHEYHARMAMTRGTNGIPERPARVVRVAGVARVRAERGEAEHDPVVAVVADLDAAAEPAVPGPEHVPVPRGGLGQPDLRARARARGRVRVDRELQLAERGEHAGRREVVRGVREVDQRARVDERRVRERVESARPHLQRGSVAWLVRNAESCKTQ
jgi:hypothetical protein